MNKSIECLSIPFLLHLSQTFSSQRKILEDLGQLNAVSTAISLKCLLLRFILSWMLGTAIISILMTPASHLRSSHMAIGGAALTRSCSFLETLDALPDPVLAAPTPHYLLSTCLNSPALEAVQQSGCKQGFWSLEPSWAGVALPLSFLIVGWGAAGISFFRVIVHTVHGLEIFQLPLWTPLSPTLGPGRLLCPVPSSPAQQCGCPARSQEKELRY